MASNWSGRKVIEARAIVATWLPVVCGRCPRVVDGTEPWVVGHIEARWKRPDLTFEVSNWRPEHRSCSNSSSQSEVIAKAKAEALAEHGVFPHHVRAEQPPLLPIHIFGHSEALEVRDDLGWLAFLRAAPDWLQGFLRVPEDASPPLAITPVHPRATGSYGAEAIGWVRTELKVDLRWWQRLAFVRQLEHDAEGLLVWRVVVESGPRRIGKSVRLRSMALWRLAHADLFGEPQLAIHTGKDREIVKEIHRQAYAWAMGRDGWDVRRGAGQEEVSSDGGANRWLVRSTDSVYGYDTTLGMVDEAWAVDPAPFDEGLEPSTLERVSPQLLLTSTAHRRATSLMRVRVGNALAAEDGETLLLLWGARPQDDPAEEQTWQAASPHWTEDRRRMIAAKLAKALAGEADPVADDPDPMQGFLAQYLNVWRFGPAPSRDRGEVVISTTAWAELGSGDTPGNTPPATAAIEAWFGQGVSLALAYRSEGRVTVAVSDHPDVEAAAVSLRDSGYRGLVTVGASLASDPALARVRTVKGESRTGAAAQELARLLAEDLVRHDGGDHLTGQVLAVRTMPGADGPRMVSTGRADAVKAAVWAIRAARKPTLGAVRIILPST